MATTGIRLSLPARPENLAVVRQALAGVAAKTGASDQAAGDIKMAVTEACTNVILHAYDGEGALEVLIEPRPEEIVVQVSDEGVGFHPRPIDDSTSSRRLGLPLIAALTTSFEVGDADSGCGTRVAMTFGLD